MKNLLEENKTLTQSISLTPKNGAKHCFALVEKKNAPMKNISQSLYLHLPKLSQTQTKTTGLQVLKIHVKISMKQTDHEV